MSVDWVVEWEIAKIPKIGVGINKYGIFIKL